MVTTEFRQVPLNQMTRRRRTWRRSRMDALLATAQALNCVRHFRLEHAVRQALVTGVQKTGHPNTSATNAFPRDMGAHSAHLTLHPDRNPRMDSGAAKDRESRSVLSHTIEATGWRSPGPRRLLPPRGRCLPRSGTVRRVSAPTYHHQDARKWRLPRRLPWGASRS